MMMMTCARSRTTRSRRCPFVRRQSKSQRSELRIISQSVFLREVCLITRFISTRSYPPRRSYRRSHRLASGEKMPLNVERGGALPRRFSCFEYVIHVVCGAIFLASCRSAVLSVLQLCTCFVVLLRTVLQVGRVGVKATTAQADLHI